MEAINWIICQDEVDEFAKMLDEFVSNIKRRKNKSNQTASSHTYILSNLPIETARKHHGYDGWKNTKKQKL